MVFPQVGKYPDFKRNSCRAVKHQSLGRHFHYHTVASCFRHFCKIFLNGVGLRGRIRRRNMFLADNRLDGADQADFVPHSVQNGFDHIGCCGLSLCTCDSDNFHLICRIAEIRRRHQRQSVPGVFYADHSHLFRNVHLVLHYKSRRAFCRHIRGVAVSVGDSPADADKHRPFLRFA